MSSHKELEYLFLCLSLLWCGVLGLENYSLHAYTSEEYFLYYEYEVGMYYEVLPTKVYSYMLQSEN